MKKLFLALCFATLLLPSKVKADDGTSMFPIIRLTNELVSYIENDMNYEIVRIEFDILSTTKTSIRTLSEGYNYTICAYGDDRFKDIDVKVYVKQNGSWVEVEKDEDVSATAVVSVTPAYTREYKIEIKAYQFDSGYSVGHYGLIICHNK